MTANILWGLSHQAEFRLRSPRLRFRFAGRAECGPLGSVGRTSWVCHSENWDRLCRTLVLAVSRCLCLSRVLCSLVSGPTWLDVRRTPDEVVILSHRLIEWMHLCVLERNRISEVSCSHRRPALKQSPASITLGFTSSTLTRIFSLLISSFHWTRALYRTLDGGSDANTLAL